MKKILREKIFLQNFHTRKFPDLRYVYNVCICMHAYAFDMYSLLSLPLSLECSSIGDVGAVALSEALRNCPSLRVLG